MACRRCGSSPTARSSSRSSRCASRTGPHGLSHPVGDAPARAAASSTSSMRSRRSSSCRACRRGRSTSTRARSRRSRSGCARRRRALLRGDRATARASIVLCATEAERGASNTVLAEAGGAAGVERSSSAAWRKGFRWPARRADGRQPPRADRLRSARAGALKQARAQGARAAVVLRAQARRPRRPRRARPRALRGPRAPARAAAARRSTCTSCSPTTSACSCRPRASTWSSATSARGGGAPALDKIGGQSFRRRKEKVERALFDLAAELLEVQAQRELDDAPAVAAATPSS